MTDVRLVAVSYFGSRDVPDLARSLREGTSPHWRLVVVDNSCDEAEAERLRPLGALDERIEVITAPHNTGYLGGARLALADPTARARWTVVCNTDLTFAPDFVALLTQLPPDRVVAPSVRSARTGRDQNPYLVRRPGPWQVRRWRAEFSTVLGAKLVVAAGNLPVRRTRPRDASRQAPRRIYAPHGSCLVLPAEYFDRGGDLTHAAFLFGEEITVAERARRLGLPVMYHPQLQVNHAEHRSTGVWRSTRMIRWHQEGVRHVVDLLGRGT